MKINPEKCQAHTPSVTPGRQGSSSLTSADHLTRDTGASFKGIEPMGIFNVLANMFVTVFTLGVSEHLLSRNYVRNKAGYLTSTLKHLDEKIKIMGNNPQQAKSHLIKEFNTAKKYFYAKYKKYLNPYGNFYKWHKIVPRVDYHINDKKVNAIVQDLKLKGFPNVAQDVENHLKYHDVKQIVETVPKA